MFTLIHGEGISKSADVLDTGVTLGLIQKNGNTFMFKDEKLGVGYESTDKYLKENRDVAKKIEADIRKYIANPPKAKEKEKEKEQVEFKEKIGR